jgi:hypothetical protein
MTEHEQLASLWDTRNLPELWVPALTEAYATLRRMGVEGDDARQEAALAAGEAVASWRPLEYDFRQHIRTKVRHHILDWLAQENARGMAGHRVSPTFVSTDERASPDPDDPTTVGERLTYGGPVAPDGRTLGPEATPAGLGDPGLTVEAADQQRAVAAAVARLAREDQELVRALFGMGRFRISVEEWATANGVTARHGRRLREQALSRLASLLSSVV